MQSPPALAIRTAYNVTANTVHKIFDALALKLKAYFVSNCNNLPSFKSKINKLDLISLSS